MGGVRRIATVLAGLVLLAVASCGDGPPVDRGRPGDVVDTRVPVPWRDDGTLDRVRRARAEAEAAARRAAALARLEGVSTVGAALRRALLTHAIERPAYDAYRAAYDGAR